MPFSRKRDAEREAFLLALTEIAKHFSLGAQAQAEAIAELAAATKAQADAMQAHLKLFEAIGAPTSRVLRDSDEQTAELRRSGFPVDAPAADQLQQVLDNS